jgi:hypothetical protein
MVISPVVTMIENVEKCHISVHLLEGSVSILMKHILLMDHLKTVYCIDDIRILILCVLVVSIEEEKPIRIDGGINLMDIFREMKHSRHL